MVLSTLLSWLHPAYQHCKVCNQVMKQQGRHTQAQWMKDDVMKLICMKCQHSIPWITHIVCDRCGRSQICPDCIARNDGAIWMTRSAVSYNETMKAWLHRYKFQGEEQFTEILGAMLSPPCEQLTMRLLKTTNADQYMCWRRSGKTPLSWLNYQNTMIWDAIVPVPITEERLQERGFNQAERIAKVLAAKYNIPVIPLLERTKQGRRQSQLSKKERMHRVSEQYDNNPLQWHQLIRKTGLNRSIHLLLVDDIYTTGGTVNSCAQTLASYSSLSVTIGCVTWARS